MMLSHGYSVRIMFLARDLRDGYIKSEDIPVSERDIVQEFLLAEMIDSQCFLLNVKAIEKTC